MPCLYFSACSHTPFQSAGGQEIYPTVVAKAAALFHSLISNHAFHNGNKRTAVLAMDTFLIGNGYSLALDNDPMYELARDTAYLDLGKHMKSVKKLLGNKSGEVLKKLVYHLFDEEVAKLPLGQVIQT